MSIFAPYIAANAAQASVATIQTTTSTSFTDLSTTGPAVTITTGTKAIVIIYSYVLNSAANAGSAFSFTISGATTQAAADNFSVYYQSYANNAEGRYGASFLIDNLTAGSNTFTMKYRAVTAGTANFQDRRIAIVPL